MQQEFMENLKKNMIIFLQNQTEQRGFDRVVFGLSGGLDSAIVALLCKEAFQDHAKAILMPSSKSSKENLEDALLMTEILKLPHELIPLKDYESIFSSYENMDKTRYGNLCARTRMMILYDFSHKDKALVVGTSNKTERLLGYGTIFGDLAYAINPIGDIFKSDLFEFAKFLKIPQRIIDKKPSADLYERQSDEEDLGFSYQEIDSFLKRIIQEKLDFYNPSIILDKMQTAFPADFMHKILKRINQNRFKIQAAPIFSL